jgi:hypothetical protein
MKNWRVLDSEDAPPGKRSILPVDRDLANIIKRTSYKTFRGLSEGTFKVLTNPEAEPGGSQVC